jgi:hypothetical protein
LPLRYAQYTGFFSQCCDEIVGSRTYCSMRETHERTFVIGRWQILYFEFDESSGLIDKKRLATLDKEPFE